MVVKKSNEKIEAAIERQSIINRKKDLEAKLIQLQREEYAIMAVIGELKVLLDPSLLDEVQEKENEEQKKKS